MNLILIIKKIFDSIKILYSYSVYHSDIKPANIVFCRHPEYDEYEPKLIDFGGSVTNYKVLKSYTPLYFYNEDGRYNG